MNIGWLGKLRSYLRLVDFASKDGGIVAELHFEIPASRLYQYHSTLPPVLACVSICRKHEKVAWKEEARAHVLSTPKTRLCPLASQSTHRGLIAVLIVLFILSLKSRDYASYFSTYDMSVNQSINLRQYIKLKEIFSSVTV